METNVPFFIISRSILRRMRNVSDKSCRGNKNTHFVFNTFFSESSAICEIKHTLIICNNYCFSTATMPRYYVILTLPVLFYLEYERG
jgi:hypothetical protein